MATLKLIAIALLIYALASGKYIWILLALVLWEVGTGFRAATVTWFTNDRDPRS